LEPRDEAEKEGHGESRGWSSTPGSGLLGLGASKWRQTPREEGREKGMAIVSQPGSADRNANEVLKGERKAKSGC
jgi:hypothetical protein